MVCGILPPLNTLFETFNIYDLSELPRKNLGLWSSSAETINHYMLNNSYYQFSCQLT